MPRTVFSAVVLAGGTGARLGGADKATLPWRGRPLLEQALDALAAAREIVVVGDPVPTSRRVRFTREQPRLGGPAAAVLAGRDALVEPVDTLAVLACDMPLVTSATIGRLVEAAVGHDGSVLVAPARHEVPGRAASRQLALVLDVARLDAIRPEAGAEQNLALRRLLGPLGLVEVPARGSEHRDIDTPEDLRELGQHLAGATAASNSEAVNLHDWIDELSDVLELEDVEVDEGLLSDLARITAENVGAPAGPVTAFLLGYAAATQHADPDEVEQLAARAQGLAENWDRPANAPDPVDVEAPIPDDGAVDHTGDAYDDDRVSELVDDEV